MKENYFLERRNEYRLPFADKIIFTDGIRSVTAQSANISRGGLFVMTLDPFPIDTKGYLMFLLPSENTSICVKAKVVHIVFDKNRCEVECGMGFQFSEMSQANLSIVNRHVLNEQMTYLELRDVLKYHRPDPEKVSRCLKKLPHLLKYDLLALRYRVNRICTIFDSQKEKTQSLSA